MRYVKVDEIILIAYVLVIIVHAFIVGFEIEALKLLIHVDGFDP